MKKFALFIVILIVIITTMLAVAAPAFAVATASCEFNAQQNAWHIVGGGQTNDHWYDTEEECLISLQVPTAMATLMATTTATTVPTDQPTVTEPPVVTETPTEPPVVTNTPNPTDPPVITETPIIPSMTPVPRQQKRVNSCERNWEKIKNLVYKDEAYRFFENHSWCKAWLFIRYGIEFDVYKALHP